MAHPYTRFWSQFDMILCINIKERTDRKRESQLVFQKMGIPVEYMDVTRHPQSGEIGCFESHQACMRKAYKANCSNVLIFEDDLDELNSPTEHMLAEVIRFIKTNREWDLLFLGAYPSVFFDTSKSVLNFTSIYKVSSQLCHAYCVSRKMMEKMLQIDHSFFNAPIDIVYLANKNSYCLFPCVFYQSDSPSDISTSLRGTPLIRKSYVQFKNMYSQYSPIPLYHVMIVLIVILFLLILLSGCRKR